MQHRPWPSTPADHAADREVLPAEGPPPTEAGASICRPGYRVPARCSFVNISNAGRVFHFHVVGMVVGVTYGFTYAQRQLFWRGTQATSARQGARSAASITSGIAACGQSTRPAVAWGGARPEQARSEGFPHKPRLHARRRIGLHPSACKPTINSCLVGKPQPWPCRAAAWLPSSALKGGPSSEGLCCTANVAARKVNRRGRGCALNRACVETGKGKFEGLPAGLVQQVVGKCAHSAALQRGAMGSVS